jgi:hypothetical protein
MTATAVAVPTVELPEEDLSRLDAIREAAPALTDRLTTQVGEIARAAQDVRANTRAMRFEVARLYGGAEDLAPRDRVVLVTPMGNLGINDIAHRQFADKVKIPVPYWNRLLEFYPEGLVDHANNWLSTEPETRLIRMLRPVTEADRERSTRQGGTVANVRAVLSDRYRTIDNYHVLNTAMETAAERGLVVKEYNLEEARLFVKFVEASYRDRSNLIDPRNHRFISQRLGFGLTLKNSEVGLAGLSAEAYVLILTCINGLITMDKHQVRHVGGRNAEDESWMGDDTKRLDDAATFLKLRDRMRELTSDEAQGRILNVMANAAGEPIVLDEKPIFEYLDGVGARFEMSEEERDILKEEVTHERAVSSLGPTLTRWTVSQGITATARRLDNYDRQVELESAGWTVLTDPTEALIKAAGKKSKRN